MSLVDLGRDGRTSRCTENMGMAFLQPKSFQAPRSANISPPWAVCRAWRGGVRSSAGSPWAAVGRSGGSRAVPRGWRSVASPRSDKLYPASCLLLPGPQRCFGMEDKGQSSGPAAPSHQLEVRWLHGYHGPSSIPRASCPAGPGLRGHAAGPALSQGVCCEVRQLLGAHCGLPQQLLPVTCSVIAGWVFFVGFLFVFRGQTDLVGWIFSLCVTCVSF